MIYQKEQLQECYEENEELLEEINECNCFDDIKQLIEWSMDSKESCNFDIIHYHITEEVETRDFNFFLTEKAYNEHIRINRHNLRNPKSYGVHCYRNEEMKTLYEIIHKLSDILTDKAK